MFVILTSILFSFGEIYKATGTRNKALPSSGLSGLAAVILPGAVVLTTLPGASRRSACSLPLGGSVELCGLESW